METTYGLGSKTFPGPGCKELLLKKVVTFLVSAVHVLLWHLPFPPHQDTQARLLGSSKVCSGGL